MKEARRAIRRYLREADMLLLFLCLFASGIGLLLIASATRSSELGPRHFLTVQILATAAGALLYLVITLFDLELLTALWPWIFVFNVVFILSLIPLGVAGTTGNKSWIRFAGIGIQPAEVVKVTFILLIAKQMDTLRKKELLNRPLPVLSLFAHFLFMGAVISFASSDDGMIIMYAFAFLSILLLGELKWRWFAAAGAGLAAAVAGVYFFLPGIWDKLISEKQRNRLIFGFNPELDPQGAGYQAILSKTAVGGGGLTGQGLFNGVQTQHGSMFAKETDFIFSVAGEELGFLGSMAILLLLAAIIARCFYMAAKTSDPMSRLVCGGVGGMMLAQTVINIGMNLALTPVIGVTLPFLSAGGSSQITMLAAMGLVSSVRMHGRVHTHRGEI